jgi:hypothetical protein
MSISMKKTNSVTTPAQSELLLYVPYLTSCRDAPSPFFQQLVLRIAFCVETGEETVS